MEVGLFLLPISLNLNEKNIFKYLKRALRSSEYGKSQLVILARLDESKNLNCSSWKGSPPVEKSQVPCLKEAGNAALFWSINYCVARMSWKLLVTKRP